MSSLSSGKVKCPVEIDEVRKATDLVRLENIKINLKLKQLKSLGDDLQLAIVKLNSKKDKAARKVITARLAPIMSYLQMQQYDLAKELMTGLTADEYISQEEIDLALSKINVIIEME